MSCPRCGSTDRSQLAPGYFECRGAVLMLQTAMVPDPGQPGMLRPLGLQDSRPCRTRYQEGPGQPAIPLCECGTFSIGICQDCRTPVCGDHSLLAGRVRQCSSCVAADKA